MLIGFKAETNISKTALIKSARKKMKESGADLVIANDIGSKYQKNPDNNQVYVVHGNKVSSSGWKKKEKIVKFIRKEIEKNLK